MSKDWLNLSEGETRLDEWCKQRGIKRFLFDLDDTICPTRAVFREVMAEAFDHLALNASFRTRDEWKTDVEEINNRLFEKIGVNPIRWNFVVDELGGKHSLQLPLMNEVKGIFQKIYKTPLAMMDGAEEGLQIIKNVGIPIGIVTHASRDWTMMKYDWLNLERFAQTDEIYVVDENGHKTSESWLQAIEYFGLTPTDCAVGGDSPRSDINPAMEAGVKHCFLVEDPNIWSIHNLPVDQSVKRIKTLKQIIEVV